MLYDGYIINDGHVIIFKNLINNYIIFYLISAAFLHIDFFLEIEKVKNKNASHKLKFNKSEIEDEGKEEIFYDKNRQVIENLVEDTAQINKAPLFLAPLTSHQVTQGNFVRLDVEVSCIAPYKVKWLRGGVEINYKNFPNLTLLSDENLHSVLIAEAQLIDTALFTCIASNTYGEASCSADLLVLRMFLGFISFKDLNAYKVLKCHNSFLILPLCLSILCAIKN